MEMEFKINLKEVIWDLLSQWKAILVVSLAMMLLVTGAKYRKDTNAYEAAMHAREAVQMEGSADERISDIIASLPDDEVATVQFLVNQLEWIETEKEYMNNSILMNTNPANQRTLLLDYYVSLSDVNEATMTALVNGYKGYLRSDNLINAVGQFVSPGVERKYISELISITDNNNSITDSASDGAVLEISIVLPSEADAEAVEKAMTSTLTEYSSELRNRIGEHSISLISSSETYLFNNDAVNNHNNIISAVYNLQNNAKNMQLSLSDGQKAAIESIKAIKKESSEIATGSQQNIDESNQELKNNEISTPGFSKKYAVLGFVLGALVYAFIYLLIIIIRGRVNYASDAQCYTQSRLIGEVYEKTEKKGLWKLLHSNLVNSYRYRNKMDADIQKHKASDMLEAVCRREGISDAVLINLSGEKNKELFGELAKKEVANGIKLKSIEVDEDEIGKRLLSTSNVFFAVDSETKVSYLTKVAALCNDYNVNTLGSIFVGEI